MLTVDSYENNDGKEPTDEGKWEDFTLISKSTVGFKVGFPSVFSISHEPQGRE